MYTEEDLKQFGGPSDEPPHDIPEESSPEGDGSKDYSAEELDLKEGEYENARKEGKEKPKKWQGLKSRLNEEKREKFRAMQELQNAQARISELEKTVQLTSQVAERHYDDNVSQNLNEAQRRLKEAIESGDLEEQAKAQTQLSFAAAEMQNLNRWKSEQEFKRNSQQYNQQNQQGYQDLPPEAGKEHIIQDWLRDNTWFLQESEDYDPVLAHEAEAWTRKLNYDLHRAGGRHEMYTPEYFEYLDRHIEALQHNPDFQNSRRNYQQPRHQSRQELNMMPSRSGVSPVRNGMSYSAAQEERYKMSPDERALAKQLGVDEKTYLKYRIKQQSDPNRRR